MATYTNPSFNDGPWARAFGDWLLTPDEASRTYANGDIVKGPLLGIGIKTVDGLVALEPLDNDASPTMTAELAITDGVTRKKLKTLTAAECKSGGVFHADEKEGVGYVTPTAGFYYEFKITGVPATAVAGKVKFGGYATAMNYKGEDPTAAEDNY